MKDAIAATSLSAADSPIGARRAEATQFVVPAELEKHIRALVRRTELANYVEEFDAKLQTLAEHMVTAASSFPLEKESVTGTEILAELTRRNEQRQRAELEHRAAEEERRVSEHELSTLPRGGSRAKRYLLGTIIVLIALIAAVPIAVLLAQPLDELVIGEYFATYFDGERLGTIAWTTAAFISFALLLPPAFATVGTQGRLSTRDKALLFIPELIFSIAFGWARQPDASIFGLGLIWSLIEAAIMLLVSIATAAIGRRIKELSDEAKSWETAAQRLRFLAGEVTCAVEKRTAAERAFRSQLIVVQEREEADEERRRLVALFREAASVVLWVETRAMAEEAESGGEASAPLSLVSGGDR